jgi:hypothetical protein
VTGLLNLSASRVAAVSRAVSPLVVDVGNGCYAWIQDGLGFTLNTRASAQWVPMTDCVGIGGHVLTASQVTALVAAYGRPTP